MLYGVVGSPVGHTKSPLLHNAWLKAEGRAAIYAPFNVEPEAFEAFLGAALAMGVAGLNVTIPFKERALAGASIGSARALSAGSANTLIREENGWRADSTDGAGFLESMKRAAWRPEGARIAMMGAGGAARAVLAACAEAGAEEIRISNRTGATAQSVAAATPKTAAWAWPPTPDFYQDVDLIIHGTSMGMAGGPPFDLTLPDRLDGVVATDLIYAPLMTPFLAVVGARGAVTVDGFGMLVEQARLSYALWFGAPPPRLPEEAEVALATQGYLP